MKKILVTGASGLLGSHIVRLLFLENKFHPIPMVRTRKQANEWKRFGLEPVIADLQDLSTIQLPADIWGVVHTAAIAGDWVDKKETFKVNVEGTKQLINSVLSLTKAVKFIYVSTIGVYGHSRYTDANEDIKYKKSSAYENSKIQAEKIVKSYLNNKNNLKFIIIRPPSMYGEGDRHILPKFTRYIRENKFLFIAKGNALYPLIHAADAAQATLLSLIANVPTGSTYHICDDTKITLKGFINILAKQMNVTTSFRSIPYWPAYFISIFFEIAGKIRRKEPFIFRKRVKYVGRSRHINISKARNELGFKPSITPEIGIPRTLAWLKAEEESLIAAKTSDFEFKSTNQSLSSFLIPFHLQTILTGTKVNQ